MAIGLFGGPCVEGHTCYIYDRGGTRRVAQILDVSNVRWTRDRDGISQAELRVEGSACSAQAEVLAAIEPKRSELVIYRGNERVWEGPVYRVGWHASYVEVAARDIFQYILETPLTQAYDNRFQDNIDLGPLTRPTEVTTRVDGILQHEMQVWEALDPPVNVLPYVSIHHFPNEARTTAYTKPFEMTVGEHIQDLAHYSGIDFACVGRALHVWDVSRPLGRLRTLTEKDFFDEVVVTAYGSEMTAAVYVIGRDGVYGYAAEASPYYGPWTKILDAWNEEGSEENLSQEELNGQAARSLSGRMPVPVEVRVPENSGIRLDSTLTINQLVPGAQVPVLATLNARTMSQLQKIDHVKVEESSDGETVQLTLTPATKPDDDAEP